ncbi:MAG: zf-HC2 domain-containing protein [Rubrobacteraceae bacterium]
MSLPHGYSCDPEKIFEFADGALPPEREREIRLHLDQCPECRSLYERETTLNSCLCNLNISRPRSVCEGVAMALPTRPLKARLLWALLAGILLSTALIALGANGVNPAVFVANAMAMFWGSAAMLRDVLDSVLTMAGGTLLIALAVGAFLDLLLAAVLLAAARGRTRQV